MNDWSDAERRVEKAQQLFEQRKWSEALREIRLATSINPYNPSWFFNMGLILDEMGRFEEALDAYAQADGIESNDIQTLYHMGVDLHRTGRLDKAIDTFVQIERLDPSFEPAYCNRIIAYAQRGEHDLAEEMFYTARLYKENCPNCYFSMGCSLDARGLYDKAIYCWMRCLDLQGAQNDVHVRIGHAYRKKGDFEQARLHMLTDLRHNPGRTQTLLDLGELLVSMGRLQDADEKFRRAIELAPSDPGGYYHHGRLLLRMDRDADAARAFSTVLHLDPTFPGAHMGLGRISYRRGELTPARTRFRAELQLRPDEPKLLLELSNLLMDTGESRAALACLKWLVAMNPREVSGWLNLAVAQFARGHYSEGIKSCMTVLSKEPANLMAMYNLGLAHERLGQYEAALNWVRQARRRDAADIALQRLEFRLRVLRTKKRVDRAIRRCTRWLHVSW